MKKNNFNKDEKRLIIGISLILGMRMIGISLIIPIFSIYAITIEGTTETLAGIAVGIFGILQTIFQVPMGRLSDRWGRKQTTIFGFTIYFVGTILSGASLNIFHLIGSRMIAGAGAVSGVTMAWLTDGIDIGRRNSALSYVGMAIGLSVIFGFTLSPIIAGKMGIPFLFYICAAMIFISAIYVQIVMKNSKTLKNPVTQHAKVNLTQIIRNRDLIRLNITGFIIHLTLTSIFFTMPILIHREMLIENMWKVYVPMAIIGTSCMYFISQSADKRGTVPIAFTAFIFIITGLLIPIFFGSLTSIIISFIMFYSGYCILSPILPAAVSRHPDLEHKGTTLSIFNSFQFIGGGTGGILGGFMLRFNHGYLFIILIIIVIIALFSISGFKDFKEG